MATVETQGYSLQKLEELLSDALPMCFYICKMLLPNEKTAMLISADAYKKVLKNPDRIPEEKDFLPWVKNVVMVACASFLKKQDEGIFLKNNPAPEIPKLEILHNRNLNVSATAKHLENLIERMPLQIRFATLCYYYNGMTVAQISTVLGVPVIRVKELMRNAAAEITGLTREFNDKSVTATKLDINALLDVCAAAGEYPQLDLSALMEKSELPVTPAEEESKPQKSGKRFAVIAAVLLVVAGVGVYIANSLFGLPPKQEPSSSLAASSNVSSLLAVTSDVSSVTVEMVESALAGVVSEPEEDKVEAAAPLYNIVRENHFDISGDKIRECAYTYVGGKLSRVQTATKMFVEDIQYKWNKKGNVRTATDGDGKVCEVTWYDKQGNPTKIKFLDDETKIVKYKWTYKFNKKGRVKSAAFKGVNSGKYLYEYTENGQIKKQTEIHGDDRYVTTYTYDEKGMVLTKVETDFDGTITEIFYTYDYEGLTFTAEYSDGRKVDGTIAAAE